MDDKVIFYKLLLSITLVITGFILLSFYENTERIGKKISFFLFIIFLLSRLMTFYVVFVVFGINPQSDIPSYYYPQAKQVLNGLIPYRDFLSSYSPLFPYFTSISLLIYDSAKSIIFFSIIIEILSLIVWYLISQKTLNEQTAIKSLFIYTFNPISIILVSISGQNQIWISLFIGLTYLLMINKNYFLAGFCFSIGFLVTKFLILLFLLPIIMFYKHSTRFLIGFIPSVVIIYSLLWLLNVDFFIPLKIEANDFTSGNVIYILSILYSPILSHSFILNTSLILVIIIFLVYLKGLNNFSVKRDKNIIQLIIISVLVFIILLLFSKKSYTNYLAMALYPIIMFSIIDNNFKKQYVFFSIFGTIAILEPTLWFRIMNQQNLSVIYNPSIIKNNYASVFFFIIIELVLITFYLKIFKNLFIKLKNLPQTN